MNAIFEQLKGKLIVSCQAWPGDPLEDTDAIRRMAMAAIGGGAAGLRINSAEHIAALRQHTNLPIIGIQKKFGSAGLRITPDFESAAAVAGAGASIIALDCTDRPWPGADPWPTLIKRIHEELHLPVMADIATLDEALAAAAAGADCVGTTLSGYTDQTRGTHGFSWSLLEQMAQQLNVPIMAEGHIDTPGEARRAIDNGAWCVIAGSAITRPGDIAAKFVRALQKPQSSAPAIGVDIGSTFVKAGVVERNGEVSHYVQVPSEAAKGRDAVVAALVQAAAQLLKSVRDNHLEVAGVGVVSGGVIDARDGSIFAATGNVLGWTGFEMRAFSEELFHLPCWTANDAHAAALSELHFGLGRGLSDFAVITVGTGVGGGIISEGKLFRGQYGFGGTIGHIAIHAGGRPCNCGRNGCLEAYVSTAALLREYREHGGTAPDGANDDAALALRINQLARSGDPIAQQAYRALSDYLAEGIADLFNLFDPQVVFLSGGLIDGYPQFVSDVEKQVETLLYFGAKRKPQVRAARAGRFAGVLGAAALVFQSVS